MLSARVLGAGIVAALPLVALATGCASWSPTGPDVRQLAEGRATASNFERQRNVAQIQSAADQLSRGDRASARKQLGQVLVRDPESSAARLLMARAMIDADDFEAAEENLRAGLASDPQSAALHYELGLLLDDRGRDAEAREHFAQAAELDPHNELYRLSHRAVRNSGPAATATAPADQRQAPPATGGGQEATREGAAARLLGACRTDEGRAAVQRYFARSLADPASAAALLVEAIETEPENAPLAIEGAAYLLRADQPAGAIQAARAGLARHPRSAVLHRLSGAAHLARQEPQAAAEALRLSLALDNRRSLSYVLLGHALLASGDRAGAEEAYAAAARLEARSVAATAAPPAS